MHLLAPITALEHRPPESRNVLRTYLPFRNKGNSFDYSSVAGSVLECVLGKRLQRFDYEHFKAKCLHEVGKRLTDEALLQHIQQMYFDQNVLCKAAPEFLLLGCQRPAKDSAASGHLSRILQSFMAQQPVYKVPESQGNFIERLFLAILREDLHDAPLACGEAPYLPFVARLFVDDLNFLTRHADYMLLQLESFLELYNFLYCAQLALNIRNWAQGEPQSKPLYFILDTEKANQERIHVRNFGYKSLYTAMGAVFPILSLLEYLNDPPQTVTAFIKQPLWQYAAALQQASPDEQRSAQQALQSFAEKFRGSRNLTPHHEPQPQALGTLELLVLYALEQFEDLSTSRHEIRDKYQKEFERHVARHFVQSRGRAGKVLVMNQDYLMLLTNLAIGGKQQLRFRELLQDFCARGVYFDKQSEQGLIAFYERIGNVNRMSDSGDAVYVNRTI